MTRSMRDSIAWVLRVVSRVIASVVAAVSWFAVAAIWIRPDIEFSSFVLTSAILFSLIALLAWMPVLRTMAARYRRRSGGDNGQAQSHT